MSEQGSAQVVAKGGGARLLAAVTVIGGAINALGDLLSPLIEIALLTTVVSASILLGVLLAAWRKRRNPQSQPEQYILFFLKPEERAENFPLYAALAALILLLISASVYMLGRKNQAEGGWIAAHFESIRGLQTQLLGIRSDLDVIGKGVEATAANTNLLVEKARQASRSVPFWEVMQTAQRGDLETLDAYFDDGLKLTPQELAHVFFGLAKSPPQNADRVLERFEQNGLSPAMARETADNLGYSLSQETSLLTGRGSKICAALSGAKGGMYMIGAIDLSVPGMLVLANKTTMLPLVEKYAADATARPETLACVTHRFADGQMQQDSRTFELSLPELIRAATL